MNGTPLPSCSTEWADGLLPKALRVAQVIEYGGTIAQN